MASLPSQMKGIPRQLCTRCSTSGLSTLLPVNTDNAANTKTVDFPLEPISTWDLESCDFCRFLFQSLPSSSRSGPLSTGDVKLAARTGPQFVGDAGVTLRALWYHDLEQNNLVLKPHNAVPGRQEPHSTIVLLNRNEWPAPLPTTPLVSFEMLSGWLKDPTPDSPVTSRKFNPLGSNRSWRKKPARASSWERARLGVLDMGLSVIDCATRHIVPLPLGDEFVTLSYVWGQPLGEIRRGTPRRPDSLLGSLRLSASSTSGTEQNGVPLPSHLPLTIEDSICVCKALRYRYLWVDRYCIPQKDHQMRARQIQQMDDIYCGSALTLIACAGSSPQYGLPGVSKPRAPSPSFPTADGKHLQMLPTVHDILSSTWASRAWTYQEALLAQRRLFFTDRQVYFESNDLVESELTALVPVVTRVLDPRIYSQVTSSTFPASIYDCIKEYTHRKLSFPSDILNALLGILTYYAREHDILHLWGIPFCADVPASIDEPPRKRLITFEESLRWYPQNLGSRRDGFPSWSWAGWFGTVKWRNWRSDLRPTSAPCTPGSMSVEVELKSGQLLNWAQYQERHAELNDSSRDIGASKTDDELTQFIHIETFVSDVDVYRREDINEPLSWTHLSLESVDGKPLPPQEPTHSTHANLPPARTREKANGNFCGIHFPSWQEAGLQTSANSLLTQDKGDHCPSWQETGMETSACLLVIQNKGDYWERIALLDDNDRVVLPHAKRSWMKVRLG